MCWPFTIFGQWGQLTPLPLLVAAITVYTLFYEIYSILYIYTSDTNTTVKTNRLKQPRNRLTHFESKIINFVVVSTNFCLLGLRRLL